MIVRILRHLVAGYSYAGIYWQLRSAPRILADGVPIYDFTDREHADALEALARHAEAVRFLAQHDPRRMRQLRRDVKRILILRNPIGPAAYMPRVAAAVLDCDMVKHPPAASAALLVHEATHARLWRRGIRDMPSYHGRIERRCNREMLAFIRQAPGAGYLEEWARQLAAAVPDYAADSAEVKRRKLAGLGQLGIPSWLARLVDRLLRASA